MKSLIVALFVVVALMGLAVPVWAAAPGKVLLVVASRHYLESEYENTRAALEDAGIGVEVASDSAELATGYGSGRVKPDLPIERADAGNYAAIAVIGGYGARDHLWDHQALQALLVRAHDKGLVVAALCAAPPVLAKAGLMKDRKATMWPDRQWIAVLEAGGARYFDAPVIVDGRIVTGRNPMAARAFGDTLANLVTQGTPKP